MGTGHCWLCDQVGTGHCWLHGALLAPWGAGRQHVACSPGRGAGQRLLPAARPCQSGSRRMGPCWGHSSRELQPSCPGLTLWPQLSSSGQGPAEVEESTNPHLQEAAAALQSRESCWSIRSGSVPVTCWENIKKALSSCSSWQQSPGHRLHMGLRAAAPTRPASPAPSCIPPAYGSSQPSCTSLRSPALPVHHRFSAEGLSEAAGPQLRKLTSCA